jgi:hypothetical protein
MNLTSVPGSAWHARHANLVLGLMMGAAILVRAHGLDEPVLKFHPTRQYRSAMIARSCYYDATPSTPAWARRVARAGRQMQPAGEPPVMEWLACASYQAVGRENLLIPRALAVLFWVVGAWPLFRVARRIASVEGALVGAAVYLFLPYGIVASRSFQPDPLMTTCALAAALALIRYDEQPTWFRLTTAASTIAVAALVKPMSVFVTVPVAAGTWIGRRGWRAALGHRQLYVLLALGLAPAAAYYGYGAVFGTLAKDQMRMRFVPALLPTSFFWHGWLAQIRKVFGLPVFALGLAAIPLARRHLARSLIAALWIGYAAFAVAFTYHMPTHDYYHLPFIAAAALAIATLVDRAGALLPTHLPMRLPYWSAVAIGIMVAVTGTAAARSDLTVPSAAAIVARDQEIGELVAHDTKVLFLDPEYGYSLMFHGQLSGDAWPNADDLAAEALDGQAPLDAEARFERDYAGFRPTYFVVTDLKSLDAEPDLVRFLEKRGDVVKQTREFQVYSLR